MTHEAVPETSTAVSGIGFGWKHPAFTPAKVYAGTANTGSVAGVEFRMDNSIEGIAQMTVGKFTINPTIHDATGQGMADRRAWNTLLDDVSDVEVTYIVDFDAANPDTPEKFFNRCREVANANTPLTLIWHYTSGDSDEADFIIGPFGKPIDVGQMVMGAATLKYAGRKASTRA